MHHHRLIAGFIVVSSLLAAGCPGEYYFRWNHREPAVQTAGGTLLDPAAATEAAREGAGDSPVRSEPISSGDYVRVSVAQICFPEDPERVLGSMFNPDVARMSYIFFATSEQNVDIWRDVESMTTGGTRSSARERLAETYRVVPSLNYTTRGGCVNRRFSTGWLPVDDVREMPRIAFTGMVMHEEEFARVTDDLGRLMDITDGISRNETAVVTDELREIMDTTGEILSVTNPNRHVLWFMEDLEQLVVQGDRGTEVITSPYLVMFAAPQQTDDTGSREDVDEDQRISTQSQLNELLRSGRLEYSSGRLRVSNGDRYEFPEPYAVVEIEVRDRLAMASFWDRMNRVLAEVARNDGNLSPDQRNEISRVLAALEQDFNLAHQVAGGVQSVGMRTLTRQQAQELNAWLQFAQAATFGGANCDTEESGLALKNSLGAGAPRDTMTYLQEILDGLKGQTQGCDLQLAHACAGALPLTLGEVESQQATFVSDSGLDVGGAQQRPDRLYRVDVPRDGNLAVTVSTDEHVRPAIGIVRGCSNTWVVDQARVISREDGAAVWATGVHSVDPGTYYVVVESQDQERRSATTPLYTIAADLLPSGAGMPGRATPGSTIQVGRAPVTGQVNLYRAAPVDHGFCGLSASELLELRDNQTFLLEVSEPGEYTVNLSGQRRGFEGVLTIWSRNERGQIRREGNCGTAPEMAVTAHLDPGQYVVAVNGRLGRAANQFVLTATPRGEPVGPGPQRACGDAPTLAMASQRVVDFGTATSRFSSADCSYEGQPAGRGPEHVFTIEVPERGSYVFAARAAGGSEDTADPVLYLRRSCDQPETEAVCNDDAEPGARQQWGAPLSNFDSAMTATLEPGRYSLIVDTFRPTADRVAVEWRAASGSGPGPRPTPTPSAAAVCQAATPLPQGRDANVTLASSQGAITPTRCGSGAGDGSEQAFTIEVTEPGEYVFVADGGEADPVLHLRSSCMNDGSQLACNDDIGEALRQRLTANLQWNAAGFQARLEPGTYTLLVDTYGLNGGNVRVGWSAVGSEGAGSAGGAGSGGGSDANAAAVCRDAAVLPPRNPRTLTLASEPGRVQPVSCGLDAAGAGSEQAFTIRVPRSGTYAFWADGPSGADTVLYLRQTCADSASQLVCNDDADAELRQALGGFGNLGSAFTAQLEQGEYTLIVDTYSTNGGQVEVQWGPAP